MTLKTKILSAWIILSLVILACEISLGRDELSEEEKLQTAVAQTVAANQQQQQQQQDQQTLPTITVAPTNAPQGPPTETPKPCNKGFLVSESPADNTEFDVGQDFDKNWRIRNDGTCTWNTNYKLAFADGDKMSGPSSKNLTQNVAPGETVDIIIDLNAPDTAGTYRGNWKLVDDQGQSFFFPYVIIKAKAILGPPPVAKADLYISEFSISPATPTQFANTHVKVRAANGGTVNSGGFIMEWYGLTTAANPSCSWNIAGGLVAGGSVLMECDYVFASWYPINKTSIVYIDTTNAVDESNEGNNSASISPFGVVAP
ncbi:MAG TPA: NBR1-Ig-like domain-containing protein [Pelolinea sp.]|nr:NBR1-Ig-like domain-containing protein [Pelolinea sp.]